MRRYTGLTILLILAGLAGTRRPAAVRAPGDEARITVVQAGVLADTVVLDEARCAAAGYLCTGFAARDEPRAIRWPDGAGPLTVRVPQPEGLAPEHALELQRQAAAGIREWQGRPLPLQVVPPALADAPVDIEVQWTRSFPGDQVGQAAVRWRLGPEGAELTVLDFVLATHTAAGAPIDPRRLRLTAAHEMGHVLGLPHSDDPADVMYSFNTAARLTFRDYRSVEVLYTLPAGAVVVIP